jgi:hypothetical protein
MSLEQKNKCPLCQQKTPVGSKIVQHLRKWIKKKQGWAMASLASKYQFADGLPQNYAKAFKYNTMAVAHGDLCAYVQLGIQYKEGHGVKQSDDKAFSLFQTSADNDHASGMCNLGVMYVQGAGGPGELNFDLARYWWKRGVDHGNSHCFKLLEKLDGMSALEEEGRNCTGMQKMMDLGGPNAPVRVRLINLKSKKYNGRTGTRRRYLDDKKRFEVKLDGDDGKIINVKPGNLEAE